MQVINFLQLSAVLGLLGVCVCGMDTNTHAQTSDPKSRQKRFAARSSRFPERQRDRRNKKAMMDVLSDIAEHRVRPTPVRNGFAAAFRNLQRNQKLSTLQGYSRRTRPAAAFRMRQNTRTVPDGFHRQQSPSSNQFESRRMDEYDYTYSQCADNGPNHWSQHESSCGGREQSPINIVTNRVVYGRPYWFRYEAENPGILSGQFTNTGHYPQFETEIHSCSLMGVPHNEFEPYILDGFHLHYAASNHVGSEHRLDGEGFPAELHIVHFNGKYEDIVEAKRYPDGLSVVAIFIEIGNKPNEALTNAIRTGISISEVNAAVNISAKPLDFVLTDEFYTYRGSTTSPGCEESVQWIVLKDPIQLEMSEMEILRELRSPNGEIIAKQGNCRPVQQSNGRVVEANFLPNLQLQYNFFMEQP